MTKVERGDVVLIGFVFSDDTGMRVRPAVVLSSPAYHRSRHDVIVGAVTSNVRRVLVGDYVIQDWTRAGLLFPSTATGVIRTVKRDSIQRRLGKLRERDFRGYSLALRQALPLNHE